MSHGIPPKSAAEGDAPFRMVWIGIAAGLLALVWFVQMRITATGAMINRHKAEPESKPAAPASRPTAPRPIQGMVLSEANIPISGVRIAAVSGYGPSGMEVGSTRSDDRGHYSLLIPPETTRITARLGERKAEVWLRPDDATVDLRLR